MCHVFHIQANGIHPLDSLLEAHGAKDKVYICVGVHALMVVMDIQKMEENFPSFLYACLDPSPLNR